MMIVSNKTEVSSQNSVATTVVSITANNSVSVDLSHAIQGTLMTTSRKHRYVIIKTFSLFKV